MKKISLLFVFFPLLLLAQSENLEVQETLHQNINLIDQFSQLAPMAINPYLTIFLTSLCSKIGFHNEFVATNPFFNSWVVLILFGGLFLFTALVGTVFKTNKVTATIGLADNYLSKYSALIINGFIILAPTFLSDSPEQNEIVFQASFITFSFKTVLVLAVSMYFLAIVMTFRFFIDILIFLSPIPLIDSVLEIFKIFLSIGFVIISIISPIISAVLLALMILISLLFYRKSNRLVNRVKYVLIFPILNLFRSKESILTDGNSLSVLILLNKDSVKFKKGKILRLEKNSGKFILKKKRLLLFNIEEEISLEKCFLNQTHLDIKLTNSSNTISLIFNRSYYTYIDYLANQLNVEVKQRATLNMNVTKGFVNKVKNMFNKTDITKLKQSTS